MLDTGPKITIFLLMVVPFAVIGMLPDAQAQTVTSIPVGDPFILGEGSDELRMAVFDRSITNADTLIAIAPNQVRNNTVDPTNQRILIGTGQSLLMRSILIDMNATLGDLQETISTDKSIFSYDIVDVTASTGNTNIYLFIADDEVIHDGVQSSSPIGTVVPLVSNGNSHESITITDTTTAMYNVTLADKDIGLYIEYNNDVPLVSDPAGHSTIAANFSSAIELSLGQAITYQNLVNVIDARNLAITQQNVIVDYWTNSNNPFADDRELAQARIDYANAHITQTIEQRDSYQTQLDQIINP